MINVIWQFFDNTIVENLRDELKERQNPSRIEGNNSRLHEEEKLETNSNVKNQRFMISFSSSIQFKPIS